MTADIRDNAPTWLEPLCRIAGDSKSSNVSIRERFTRAAPDLEDPEFVDRVRGRLSSDPALVQSWQQYSYDKRGTPSPYLDELEVGFADLVDGKLQTRDVRRHVNAQEACADFIRREALWVLKRQQPVTDTPPSAQPFPPDGWRQTQLDGSQVWGATGCRPHGSDGARPGRDVRLTNSF